MIKARRTRNNKYGYFKTANTNDRSQIINRKKLVIIHIGKILMGDRSQILDNDYKQEKSYCPKIALSSSYEIKNSRNQAR